MNTVRVLQIVSYMGRGGLETMIMNYYRNIDRNKVQFDFLVHFDVDSDYNEEIKNMGGNIYLMPRLNPFSINYYRTLYDFFSKHSYNIVHCHLDCLSVFPLIVAKKCGIKTRIAHAHSSNQIKNLKYIVKYVSKNFTKYFATDLFACGEQAGLFMFNTEKFSIFKNAIDINQFKYDNYRRNEIRKKYLIDDKYVVGHVGRFDPAKNHMFLLDIFYEIQKQRENSILILIGEQYGNTKIKEKAKKLGIDSKIMFMGVRTDVCDFYQAFDVFVLPSLYEGLPVSIIEAQTSGLPCFISDKVPDECICSDLVSIMNLSDSPKQWACHIINKQKNIRDNYYSDVIKSGYDVKTEANKLAEFYISKNNPGKNR